MGFLVSIITGPVLGLVGSWVSSIFAERSKRLELEAKKLEYSQEKELLSLRFDAQKDEREDEKMIKEIDVAAEIRSASYKHDESYGTVSPQNAAALRWVRPVLTGFLMVLVACIYFTINDGASIEIDGEVMTIKQRVVISILMLTETSLAWWFGDAVRRHK